MLVIVKIMVTYSIIKCMFIFAHRIVLEEQSPPITCRSCDLNKEREIQVGNYILWIADSAILVFQSCETQCILTQTLDFDSSVCSPSYLQPSGHDPHRAYVICDSRPRILSISYNEATGNFSIKRPFQEAKGGFTLTRGVVISGNADNPNGNDDYLIWIASDRRSIGIYALYGLRQVPSTEPVPLEIADCGVFEALYPMDATPVENHPRFLLQCRKNDASKLHEITLDFSSGTLLFREVPSSVGSPIASPGSTYLCLQSNFSITIYRTDDYSRYSPKNFDGPITAAYFVPSDLTNGTLSLVVITPGRDITLIDVAEFYDNPNSGAVSIPESAANCATDDSCLPQRIFDSHYLVIVKDGSAWKAHIYRLDSLAEPPTVIPDINSQPEIAFLQPDPAILSSVGSSPGPTHSSTPNPPTGSTFQREIVAITLGTLLPGVTVIVIAVVCSYCCWRRRITGKYSRGSDAESPSLSTDSDSTFMERESQFGVGQSSPEAEKPDQNGCAVHSTLVKDSANPNLNPSSDKSLAEKEVHKHPPTLQPKQPQTVAEASTPHSDKDKIVFFESEHAILKSDRDRIPRPTDPLAPQPDSGINSSTSSLSIANSSSSASLPSRSSSSIGSTSPRSNTPDGSSLPGDLAVPTQVSNSSSTGGPPELVAPHIGHHPTSP